MSLILTFIFVFFTLFLVSALQQNGLRESHSSQSTVLLNNMKVVVLPALSDNYMYLVSDGSLLAVFDRGF